MNCSANADSLSLTVKVPPLTRRRVAEWPIVAAKAAIAQAVVTAVGWGVVAAVNPARACDYCAPGSVNLVMGLRQSDASVAVELTSKRLVFRGEGSALAECQFKIARVLVVTPNRPTVAVGETFRAIVEPRQIGSATKAVAMVTASGTPRTLFLQDLYPDPTGRVGEYLKSVAALEDLQSPEAIAAFGAHLEAPEAAISEDAHSQFAAIPFDKVKAAADRLPAHQLRQWVLDSKISAQRRGTYAMLLGIHGKADDTPRLRAAFEALTAADQYSGAPGFMAGLCLLTGHPQTVLGPIVADPKKPHHLRTKALMVARGLYEKFADQPAVRDELLGLFRTALNDKVLSQNAVDQLARAKIVDLTDEIKTLWLDPQRSTHGDRVYINYYMHQLPQAQKAAFKQWLADNPPPQPPAPEAIPDNDN